MDKDDKYAVEVLLSLIESLHQSNQTTKQILEMVIQKLPIAPSERKDLFRLIPASSTSLALKRQILTLRKKMGMTVVEKKV